jgi:hypothetical protein
MHENGSVAAGAEKDFKLFGRLMQIKYKALTTVLAVLLLPIFEPAHAAPQAAEALPLKWLVAGPFASVGDNALFKDYLSAPAGEIRVRARETDVAGVSNGASVKWSAVVPDGDGQIDFSRLWPSERRAVAYAFTELESQTERHLVATIGSGSNLQVRLNGEIIYESRQSRKPEPDVDTLVLKLHKGLNTLLVKVEAAQGEWKLRWRTHTPAGSLFVNRHKTIIPDFRVGEHVGAWGQLEVANASAQELTNVTVEVIGDDMILPALSAAVSLSPGEVQRIPFWVAGRTITPEARVSPLRLRVTAGSEAEGLEVTPLVRKATEFFVTTYRSFVDGSVQPYSVLLPTSYDPVATYPLIVLLHGAHVTDWGQNILSYTPKEWAIQVAVHDRGNNRYRDIGEVDLEEVLTDVKRRYRIDVERMYLSGHSMGGYGTWFQATRHPDRWASISPQAGYSDYFLYHPAMREGRGKLLQPFQIRLLEHWSPLTFAENLLHVPAYIVHGAKDDNVVVEHSRKMDARLRQLDYTHVYDENPEGGHWWGPRGTYYGVEVVDKPPIWTFFQKHSRRVVKPRRVVYSTDTLHYREAYWVAIDELDRANQLARIEAELTEPSSISVRLSNITQFTLKLDNGLVAPGETLSVSVDGRTAFRGLPPASARLTLRREVDGKFVQLLNSADIGVARPVDATDSLGTLAAVLSDAGVVERIVARKAAPLKKSARLYGPISDAFNTPVLFVTGTAGRDASAVALQDSSRRAAQALAREWMARANGIVRIKSDIDVTREDIASYNLVLFGNTRVNSLIAQINDDLPLKFKGVGIAAGGQFYAENDVGMVMTWPSPLNRERYVVIVGGTTPRSMETAARLRFTELPDYVVFDSRALEGEEPSFIRGGFFDKFWQLADPIPQMQTMRR